VTPFTRVILVVAAILAIIAGVQLYIFTDMTDQWFAWTIAAPISATFLGAGYWTGATLLLLAARERAWANIRIAMAAVGAFVPMMVVTTVLHLNRFHLSGDMRSAVISGWAWIIVYAAVPFLVAAIFFVQMRTPGGDPPRQAPISSRLRVLIGVNGVVSLLLGAILFVVPQVMARVWPWPLTALTARAIGAGFMAMAAGSLQFVRESDWSRARIGTIPYLFVGILQLFALTRYPATVAWSRPGAWLYVLFMVGVLGGGLYSTVAAWRPQAAKR
jgi:hypothetical protein